MKLKEKFQHCCKNDNNKKIAIIKRKDQKEIKQEQQWYQTKYARK